MAQHEARLSGRCPAVFAIGNLDVGPANADGDGFHEDRSFAHIGLRNRLQKRAARFLWFYSNSFHLVVCFFLGWIVSSMATSTWL
jgi:hypothetical protein